MADPKNFLFNTDYPMDKVAYVTSGSEAVASLSRKVLTIPHGLSFIPEVTMQWSFDSDFTTSYTEQSGPSPTTPALWHLGATMDLEANATNIVLTYDSFISSPTTFYYRLFAYEPPLSDSTVPPTAASSDNFVINTSHNYPKIFMSGILDTTISTTITHNLGYIPQFEHWFSDGTTKRKAYYDLWFSSPPSGSGVYVTTTTIVVSSPHLRYLHYRIYADEA